MEKGITSAIEGLEKENANLEPELLTSGAAREMLALYVRAQNLVSYGIAALSRKVADTEELARMTGSSAGKARAVAATGKVLAESDDLSSALESGGISLDQAVEIAAAEDSAPGAAKELVAVAQTKPFHTLKDQARKTKLEAEQRRGLAERQRQARGARSYSDELGMVHIHMQLQPHVGTPIVARAEAEAQRRLRADKDTKEKCSFSQAFADAFVSMVEGKGKGRAKRPELVILVHHSVVKRGWKDVREDEMCKIPGVGPVDPSVAKEVAQDAFLNGVFFDGTDLRNLKRWSKDIPTEIRVALELGPAPDFDGVRCIDCGNRFRPEIDHQQPRFMNGPTALPNLGARCHGCHGKKSEKERQERTAKARARGPGTTRRHGGPLRE